MFQFMRPVQDPNLRIMIPEELEKGAGGMHQQNHSGGGGSGHWSSNESEEEEVARSPTIRRKFKAYTVMQRSGFQHTEYVQILTHLCKAEIFISMLYGIHGVTCPGFPEESAYQGTCHINVLAALVGLFTGGMGIGAVHRFRWRTMLVCWLIMCIISAVANLLAVITDGVWLDHLSKLKTRTGMANGLSGMMLLGSVLVGVCFILTSVLICHYWASNSTRYQPVGRIAKRSRVLRRRSSKATAGSGTERTTSIGSRGGGTTFGGSGGGGGNGRFGAGGSLGSGGGGHCSYQMDSGGHSPPTHWRGDAGNRGSRQISPKSDSGGGSPRYEIV